MNTVGRRFVRPDTAFSLTRSKTKRPRIEDGKHLKFIRELPCCICGTRKNVEAAHVRLASLAYGKPETGMGTKPHDRWTTSLCADHHREQHSMGEAVFWKRYGIDPCLLAVKLWSATGQEEEAETILAETTRTTNPASMSKG